jgi:N-acyl homoserine lactone hydrolase
MKIDVLNCGYIRIPERLPGGSRGFADDMRMAAMTPDRRRITLPVYSYLIEHPKGLFLVDTGWSREISPAGTYDRKAVERVLPAHLAALYRPYVPTGMTAVEQLAARGIKPGDIDAVLITHFDADHVSGLRSLSGAGRIVIPEEESYWSARTKYKFRQVRDLWDIAEAEHLYYRGYPLGPMNRIIDITGDNSIMMVSLPGHTDGLAGVVARSANRFVLIASDAAFDRRNWEQMTVPGFSADAGLQKKSLEWIAGIDKDPECEAVLCSHDPDAPQTLEF